MDYLLDRKQEGLQKKTRTFLEKACPESVVREAREDEDGYSPKLWKKIAKRGWLGLALPEQYGGSGGSLLDLAVLNEEIGRAVCPGPHLSTMLSGLILLDAGNASQKKTLLPQIAAGELIAALALTEPQSAWNGNSVEPAGITVKAVPEGNKYVINGTKLLVYDAHIADAILCVARTKARSKGGDGITLFLVDAKSPGLKCKPLKTTAYDKPCEVVFKKVQVPKSSIVGKVDQGWAPLAKVLQIGAVLTCAQMVGSSQKALELAVDHAKTRMQFDMPIGVHQYVQGHCIDVLWYSETSRWLTYQAAWKLSEGLPAEMEVAMAKAWTNKAHEKACWHAHQVLAGVGYTAQKGAMSLYSMKGLSLQNYLGETDYYLEKIAKEMEKWPAPEQPHGKPLGFWGTPIEEQTPAWEPWRQMREGKKTW